MTRKILAYEKVTGGGGYVGLALMLILGAMSVSMLHYAVTKEDPRALVGTVLTGLGAGGCAFWSVFDMAKRLRQVRRHLGQCAVVEGRVTAAPLVERVNKHGYYMELCLTVEYVFAGRTWEAQTCVEPPMGALIGWTPELLVDTQNPASILFRDFYS